jgi:hypothetical protein
MRLIINTAVAGHFLPPPDESTVWPQRMLVDWVRVYAPADEPGERRFANGGFEADGGALAGWHAFGNRATGEPNVLVHNQAVREGKMSLKLSGQATGGENYSGATQGITAASGDRLRARVAMCVPARDSLAGSDNRATMKIEFYDNFGDYFGGPAMLGFEERVIADAATDVDQWREHEIVARAPEGTVEARLSIVFAQPTDKPGAVHVDAVEFTAIDE